MFSRPVPVPNYLGPRWTAPVSFTSLAVFRLFCLTYPLYYSLISLLLLTHLPPTSSTTSTTLAACPIQSCATAYSPTTDYFPIKVPSSTPDFSVTYFPSYKFILNNLTTGAETYLLYQCGTPRPSLPSSPTSFPLDPSLSALVTNRTKAFSVPLTTIGVDSSVGSVAVTFLELLGLRSAITHLDPTYITSPCIHALISNATITPLTFNSTTAPAVQLLLEGNSPSAYPNSISIAASADLTVLRRAGWVKLVALFFNKEEAALGLYNTMVSTYQELASPPVTSSPVVAWVSVYGGAGTITRSPYRDALVMDASATPYSGVNVTTTYTAANVSAFKAALQGVQVLVDESYFISPPNYTQVLSNLGFTASDPSSPLYPFLQRAAVWRVDGRLSYNGLGNDWYEAAEAEPDAVLADFLLTLANYTTAPPTAPWSQLWFRHVGAGAAPEDVALTCPDPAAPALPLYEYWGVTAASLPTITCPPYLLDATLYGGGRSLSGCPVLPCVAQGGYSPATDYFPIKVPSHSPEWSIAYFPSYKFIVNNLTATPETYLLYQCGTPLPAPSSTPGFNASSMLALDPSLLPLYSAASTKAFATPVKRVAIDDSLGSVGVTYLELLGVRGSLAYVDASYVSSPCVDYLATLEVIAPLPATLPSYSQADLILEGNAASAYPTGVSIAATAAIDDLEGYASWLLLLSTLFNKEATGLLLYQQQVANIAAVKAAATSTAGAAGRRVAWVSYYGGSWTVEDSTFRRALVADAGGVYVAGGTYTSAAAFKAALVNVSALVDESYIAVSALPNVTQVLTNLGFTTSDLTSPLYPFLLTPSVWRVDGRSGATGGDDWYETAVAEPDAVLADFVRVVQPAVVVTAVNGGAGLWFRNVGKGDGATVLPAYAACSDPSAPALPLWGFGNTTLQALPPYTCPAFLLNATQTAGVATVTLYNLTTTSTTTGGSSGSSGSSTGRAAGGGVGGGSSTASSLNAAAGKAEVGGLMVLVALVTVVAGLVA